MIESIRNDNLKISVESFGAELVSLKTVKDDLEFIWQGNSDFWSSHSPILFPIVGGLPDEKYELDGKMYEMNTHGFARKSEFKLVEKTQSELIFRLRYSQETIRQYPYKFELNVSYKIEMNVLRHSFSVINLDDMIMLFSVGAHPGFNCPLKSNEKMEDYRLVFEKEENLKFRIKRNGLLTGEKLEFMNGEREKTLSQSLLSNGAIILDGVKSKWLEIRNSKNNKNIRVEFEGFPYLGICSPNNGPYVCIEPWYGIDSTVGDQYDFFKKEGLQSLAPGHNFRCEYTITLE